MKRSIVTACAIAFAAGAARPPSYCADRATFAARLKCDIEVKARLQAKMPTQ
jgi:hypothetical protein